MNKNKKGFERKFTLLNMCRPCIYMDRLQIRIAKSWIQDLHSKLQEYYQFKWEIWHCKCYKAKCESFFFVKVWNLIKLEHFLSVYFQPFFVSIIANTPGSNLVSYRNVTITIHIKTVPKFLDVTVLNKAHGVFIAVPLTEIWFAGLHGLCYRTLFTPSRPSSFSECNCNHSPANSFHTSPHGQPRDLI
jgi:hypothetical protein